MSAVEVASPRRRAPPTLERHAFRTSRLAEFCSERELVAQTGHSTEDWPIVILKELCDNSLDECEEARIAPEIEVTVSTENGAITVADNGRGIPAETVRDVLDYSSRTSSREAYVSPTRGAQGNALKVILAMGFALDGQRGEVVIESRGERHSIIFTVDHLRQQPAIDYRPTPLASCKNGTRVTVFWPDSSSSLLADAEERFLQIADDFAWLNPHLSIRVEWDGSQRVKRSASNPAWQKWRACDPTSAHWYDLARLERYVAAHVSRGQDRGSDRPTREFIAELRGFSGSAKQKVVLDQTGLARAPLSSLFEAGGKPREDLINALLGALKAHSKPVKPQDLGLIGQDHLRARFNEVALHAETFKYRKALSETEGLPWVVETAFGWCPSLDRRRIVVGVNWSVGLNNPFRSFRRYGGEGLESLLAQQWAGRDEPIVFVLHFVCPRVGYTDRGKSAIVLPGGPQ